MDDFERQTQAFLAWFSVLPGASIHPDVSLADLRGRGAGRGIVALRDIPADTDLFTIPRSAVITSSASDLASRIPHVFESVEDPWLALILILLYEHGKGDDSPWKDYLGVLPDRFDTLMFWSEQELDGLQASDVRSKIGKASADALFMEKVIPVVRENLTIFNVSDDTGVSDETLLQLAHRMGSTIMAYAFDLERDTEPQPDDDGYETEDEEYALLPKGMVPLADMLNADAEFNAHLFQGSDSLTMKSLRPISQGEEILNDYGPLPRADLLRRYGYVAPKYARYDVVELPRNDVVELCQEATGLSKQAMTAKVDSVTDGEVDLTDESECFLLERENEDTDDSGLNSSVPKLQLPQEAVLLAKLLLADAEEGARLKKLDPARKAELEQQAGKVLEQQLQKKLRAYATTVAQDQTLLRQEDLARRRRLAIEVRLGEKQLLHEAIELAREMQQTSNGHVDDAAPTSKRQRTA